MYLGSNTSWQATGINTSDSPGFYYNATGAATAAAVNSGGESFDGATAATVFWGLTPTQANNSSIIMGPRAGSATNNMITWGSEDEMPVRVNGILDSTDADPLPPLNVIQSRCAIFRTAMTLDA